MALNADKVNSLSTGFKAIFTDSFNNTVAPLVDIATRVQSSNLQENYAWVGAIPDLVEWVGARQVKEFTNYEYVVRNRLFESTVGVPATYIEFDNAGVFAPAIRSMAEKAKKHPASLVSELLTKGHLVGSKGYDGVSFFGSHAVGTSTYINKSTLALDATNLAAAYDFMLSIKNEDGKAIGVTPNVLVVGAALRGTAHSLLKVQTANGNPTFGLVELMVDPNIAGGAWYLLDTTKSVRPIVLQVAKEPKFERDDKGVFDEAVVKFGTSWFGNAGYGMWQFAYMGGASA